MANIVQYVDSYRVKAERAVRGGNVRSVEWYLSDIVKYEGGEERRFVKWRMSSIVRVYFPGKLILVLVIIRNIVSLVLKLSISNTHLLWHSKIKVSENHFHFQYIKYFQLYLITGSILTSMTMFYH